MLTTLRTNALYNSQPITAWEFEGSASSIWKSDVHSHPAPDTEMNDRWDEPEYNQAWAANPVYDGECNEKCMNFKLLYYAHATHLGLFVGRCANEEVGGKLYVTSEQVQRDWGFICRSNTDTKENQIQYIEDVFGAELNQLVTDYLPISKTPYGLYCPPPVEYRPENEQCTNGSSPIEVVPHVFTGSPPRYPNGYEPQNHIALTSDQFQLYVNVLNDAFHVYGREQVGVEKMRYIGSVLSYLLDYDQDGEVDDPALAQKLRQNHAHMIVISLEDEFYGSSNNFMTYENNLQGDQGNNNWGSKKQFFRPGYLMDHGKSKYDLYQDGNINPLFMSASGWTFEWLGGVDGNSLLTDSDGNDVGEPYLEYDKIDPYNPGYPRMFLKEDWGNFVWDTTVEKAIMNIVYWGLSESDPDNFAYDNADSTLRTIMDQWIEDGKYDVSNSELCIEGITCGDMRSMGNSGPFMDCTACQATRFVAFAARQRMGLFGPLPGSSKEDSFIRKSLDPNYPDDDVDWTCGNDIAGDVTPRKSPIYGTNFMTDPHCSNRKQWMDENSDDATANELNSQLAELIERVPGFTFIPQRDYCVPDAVESPTVTAADCHTVEINNFNKDNGMVDQYVDHQITNDALRHDFLQFFATKIELFNGAFTIFAEEGVSQENMHYAAHVATKLLDPEGTGSVYDAKLEEYLWAQIAHIAIFKKTSRHTQKKAYFEALSSSSYPMLAALQENEMEPGLPGLPGNDETIRMIFMNIQTLGWKYIDEDLNPTTTEFKNGVTEAATDQSTGIWEVDKGWYKMDGSGDSTPDKPYSDCERVSSSVEKNHDECKAQQLLYLGWATKMGFFRSTGGAAGSWFNRRTPRAGGRCLYAWDIYRWEFCDYDELTNFPDNVCTKEMDQKNFNDDTVCDPASRWKKFTFIQDLLEKDSISTHLPKSFDIKPFKYNSGRFSDNLSVVNQYTQRKG